MQPRYVKQLMKFVFLFEIAFLTAGCSFGGFKTGNSHINSASELNEKKQWHRFQPATLSLSNLPAIESRIRSAAISYKLNNSFGNERVHCRRDSFKPGPCPNPFVWATSESLTDGSHKVDFYIDRGEGIDEASPEVSYTWNIISGSPDSKGILSLSNLPAVESKKTTASIRYKLNNAAGTERVLCRIDSNVAGPCPKSFIVGKSAPLSIGTHKVDFYVDRGAGIDENSPDLTYSWNIVSGAVAPLRNSASTDPLTARLAPSTNY